MIQIIFFILIKFFSEMNDYQKFKFGSELMYLVNNSQPTRYSLAFILFPGSLKKVCCLKFKNLIWKI